MAEEFKKKTKDAFALGQKQETTGELHILMIGKPGMGKSSLANALLGKDICNVGSGPNSISEDVDINSHKVGSVKLMVYDTQGLFDDEEDFDVHVILEKIKNACKGPKKEFDIIIVCMKFHDRFEQGNKKVFRVLSDLQLGDIWSKVSIALTCADVIPASTRAMTPDKQEIKFTTTQNEWETQIRGFLASMSKPVPTASISFYPTSNPVVHPLPYGKQLNTWLIRFVVGVTKTSASSSCEIAMHIAVALPEWCVRVGLGLLKMYQRNPKDIDASGIAGLVKDVVAKTEEGLEKLISVIGELNEAEISATLKLISSLKEIIEAILCGAGGGGLTAAAGAAIKFGLIAGLGIGATVLAVGFLYLAYKHLNKE